MGLKDQIKQLLKEQNKLLKDLCTYIGMTDGALRKIFARNSCEMSTLKKIAEFFDVAPSYFLMPDNSAEAPTPTRQGDKEGTSSFRAVSEFLAEISAQRRLTERALDEIDKLVDVIDRISK